MIRQILEEAEKVREAKAEVRRLEKLAYGYSEESARHLILIPGGKSETET